MADEVDVGDLLEELDLDDIGTGDLEILIEEYERQGVGPRWLQEIQTAASRVVRKYSPSIYARSAAWDDEAVSDLVQDVVERILTKGQAEYICDVANDFGHARALIYRQVRMTLIDRRQRTSVDNLFDRAVDRLGEPPFERVKEKPRSWRIAGHSLEATPYTRRLTASLAALPRLPGNGTQRASPIWTTVTLTDALVLICNAVSEVEELDLRKILDESLTVFATAEVVSNEAGSDERSGELDPSDLIMANELIERLDAALTKEESTVLAGKWIGDSDGDIAGRLGVSRPTAAKHKASAFTKIQDELTSQKEAVVGYVLERVQSIVITKAGGGTP
ncbi:helix-turn-helix transcriptional regulator [Mycobacterium hodleri]|uniref:Helix-turn-helix transcriptional regulator n=1 Tax=Mycolicibacterium hodleri TaxID=49897 RepID=A0A544VWQ8_9MYCO|nr:helix-turn-helix transcriptional regulator [Mycolicibacterium hodleri]TQR84412.1 helix-turn-helix transcriptional regulator [Mycolicibacterium hodleri]